MRAMIWLAVATLGAGLVTACKDSPTKENQENQAPAANFFSTCSALRCDFQDASSDVDGNIVSWNWSFGTAGSARRIRSMSTPLQARTRCPSRLPMIRA